MSEYTPRAQRVLQLAQEEAERLNCAYIGTEHLVLALLRDGRGVGAAVLNNLGSDLDYERAVGGTMKLFGITLSSEFMTVEEAVVRMDNWAALHNDAVRQNERWMSP